MVRVDMAAEQVMDMRLEHTLEADMVMENDMVNWSWNTMLQLFCVLFRNNAVRLFYDQAGFESRLGEFFPVHPVDLFTHVLLVSATSI